MKRDFYDKDLDFLFKKRANDTEDEPEFEEAAWEDMERRLDKRKRKIILYYWSVAASLILLIGLSWMVMPYFSGKSNLSGSQNQVAIQQPSYQQQHAKSKNINELNKKPSSSKIDAPALTVVNPIADVENREVIPSKKKPLSRLYAHHQNKEDLNKIISDNELDTSTSLLATASSTREKEDAIYVRFIPYQNNFEIQPQEILSNTTNALNSQNKSSATKPFSNPIQWTLGFSAGPELNTASQPQNGLTSLNTGIALEAQKNKFLLSIGLKYGIKNYNANTNQYHRINPIYAAQISNIKASCDVLEIPLVVSYQTWKSKTTSTQLNAGLSSYFMLKEQYTYQYDASSGLTDYNLIKINQNQHYFKVLNLSVSQNFKLRKQPFIIGIEPFAKLPLAGVGYGTVKLKSYGINLNFWYGLKKK